MLQQLREEIRTLQMKLHMNHETNYASSGLTAGGADLTQKLLALEEEVQIKRSEIHNLKEQVEYAHYSVIPITVEPVLKDHPIGHKNVVWHGRWSLVTARFSYNLKCTSFCQKSLYFQDRCIVSHTSDLSRLVSLYIHKCRGVSSRL